MIRQPRITGIAPGPDEESERFQCNGCEVVLPEEDWIQKTMRAVEIFECPDCGTVFQPDDNIVTLNDQECDRRIAQYEAAWGEDE